MALLDRASRHHRTSVSPLRNNLKDFSVPVDPWSLAAKTWTAIQTRADPGGAGIRSPACHQSRLCGLCGTSVLLRRLWPKTPNCCPLAQCRAAPVPLPRVTAVLGLFFWLDDV